MSNGNRFFDKGNKMPPAGLIVNATAPVDEITITVDNRFQPPNIQMKCSRNVEGPIICKILIYCVSTILDLMMNTVTIAGAKAEPVPDLPKAPEKTD